MAKRYARFVKPNSPWFIDEKGRNIHIAKISRRELEKLVEGHHRNEVLLRDAKVNGIEVPVRAVDKLTEEQERDLINLLESIVQRQTNIDIEEILWLKTKDPIVYKIKLETFLQSLRSKTQALSHSEEDWLSQVKQAHE